MKPFVLLVLLMVSTFVWAAPNPDEYPINVHVTSSYFVASPGIFDGSVTVQKLCVVIDGKKYELTALATKAGLVALGDYKARLMQDEHKTAYESSQAYEFSFPDKKVRKFFVTGQTE
jgi:hypothetical protein